MQPDNRGPGLNLQMHPCLTVVSVKVFSRKAIGVLRNTNLLVYNSSKQKKPLKDKPGKTAKQLNCAHS